MIGVPSKLYQTVARGGTVLVLTPNHRSGTDLARKMLTELLRFGCAPTLNAATMRIDVGPGRILFVTRAEQTRGLEPAAVWAPFGMDAEQQEALDGRLRNGEWL